MDEVERKKRIRRTTLIVAAIALAFYLGFILMGVLRA
tara:strand:+ start:9272 stop:9382 length:111 start_codon:yes stop_codon:yes gene_type:complete